MTKILYNSSIINSGLIPNLNGVVESFTKCLNTINNVYIPSGFKYATYLNEFKDFLYNRKSSIDNIKFVINKNNNIYNEISTLSNNEIAMISNIRISKRDSAVR